MINVNVHRAVTEQEAHLIEQKPPSSGVRYHAARALSDFLQPVLLGAALLGLGLGLVLPLLGRRSLGDWAFIVSVIGVLTATTLSTARRLWRGELGVDLIAVLAMAGALALREYLAASILAVMLTGGTALERYALARARRELSALIQRAPRTAHRRAGADVIEIGADEVVVGDLLIVKPGEVVPVDGIVSSGNAVLDESALTGESKPAKLEPGVPVRSGGTNAGGPFELRATSLAAESTYAGIVRLVRAAEQSKAPFERLADRYALGFLVLTLALAAFAWLGEGSLIRALSVLVVATPCPLILAAPAAIIAGVSRAAKHGIIVKGGGPLETLARATVVLLDKTGTVTSARPEVVAVETFGAMSADELVRYAASLEQLSVHPYAPAILAEARNRSVELAFPLNVHEQMGTGVSGLVAGRQVAVGRLHFVAPNATPTAALHSISLRTAVEGSSSVYVSLDGVLGGVLLLQDPIRPEASRALRSLRAAGVQRVHMVTGDHPDVAELVADALGVDRVFAERTPAEKVEVIRLVRSEGITVMVGDGVNDAPALALADVGVAMGARGATAASEAADVVLTSDRLEGLVHATRIAQRTRRIALESVLAGMGLSLLAMGFAAAGYIVPVTGALLQEGIDVLVILNALRALGGPDGLVARRRPEAAALAKGLAATHRALRPHVGDLAALAARLESLSPAEARAQLERTREMLEKELIPHEREEQQNAYPVLSAMLKDEDPTGPLIQTHHEIHRLSRLFGRLVAQLPAEGPSLEDLPDLRRVLYGLHAILQLHFGQEDDLYSLFEE
ncbi:MAG TPA: heavy metal translocating P-type ATPase [Steroidobacteraceae bacterium]|nr:heavy metal translocating P-type ATPase [Steroidobacteraceae bacterium]